MKLELNSSRIKFEDLLTLVDKAINSGEDIQIKKSMLSQNNTTMRFLMWLESHKIISLNPVEVKTPKTISIRSRQRKVEISLQFFALEVPMKEIAKKFNVKLGTAQGYLKELAPFADRYLQTLKTVLRLKGINKETELTKFPLFPIRIQMMDLQEGLKRSEYDNLMNIARPHKYIQIVTGQKLGTSDLSILLPK